MSLKQLKLLEMPTFANVIYRAVNMCLKYLQKRKVHKTVV